MKIGPIDLDKQVLVIAEVGNNHEGSFTLAQELVGLAAEAGADAVKFQTIKAARLVRRSQGERLERLRSFELSAPQFEELARQANEAGLIFLSTPFDPESVAIVDPLVPAFKVASGDNTHFPLLEEIAGRGKPVLLSTGLSWLDDALEARAVIRRRWKQLELTGLDVIPLHCVSAYPVPPEQANLAAIRTLSDAFGSPAGYSDHTLGPDACVLAVALGSRVLEKHFTKNKLQSAFRDHQLSADPSEMRELVTRVRAAEALIGDGIKAPQPCEEASLVAVRRSIVARRDLPVGRVITWDDLDWVRPGGQVAPGQERLLLGHTLRVAVAASEAIIPELLE
jgi:N,N'-diacetyllegionaminate synthase